MGETVSEKVAGKRGDLRVKWPDDRRLTAPWEDWVSREACEGFEQSGGRS